MLRRLLHDVESVLSHDPAARSRAEVLLAYPGVHAVWLHAVAHALWKRDARLAARVLANYNRFLTGVDIHPGARLGEGVFIDHGMGVVIGETAVVGDGCIIYKGVVLGGTSLQRKVRHPQVGRGVVIGSNACILGAISVGDGARVGSGSVVVKDVPPGATVVGVPGRVVLDRHSDPAEALNHANLPDPVADLIRTLAARNEAMAERLAHLERALNLPCGREVPLSEEMGVTLCRTAFSPNIKERKDFSCALFDGEGHMIAQAEHIPVHLGAMPMSVLHAIEHVDMQPGDGVLVNDPYGGGTHLPDITLVTPIFLEGVHRPAFFAANRAHHADVGGMTPGSMPLSTEVFQEGIRIPPIKIMVDGRIHHDLLQLILANVRTPREREGDLTAQIAANRTGERRLRDVIAKYGLPEVLYYSAELQRYAERMTRRVIADIPDGEYQCVDYMDDDGITAVPV
jgi:serine O-acetyltransferase